MTSTDSYDYSYGDISIRRLFTVIFGFLRLLHFAIGFVAISLRPPEHRQDALFLITPPVVRINQILTKLPLIHCIFLRKQPVRHQQTTWDRTGIMPFQRTNVIFHQFYFSFPPLSSSFTVIKIYGVASLPSISRILLKSLADPTSLQMQKDFVFQHQFSLQSSARSLFPLCREFF
jgi:hypothetical protein